MLNHYADTLKTLFASTVEQACGQTTIPSHSPGAVTFKTIKAEVYAYWRTYQADGKRKEEYLGNRADAATEAVIEERQAIAREQTARVSDVQLLRKAGFNAVDNSTAVTLATLFNAGVFFNGGLLVGAHAFGAMLNHLGISLPRKLMPAGTDLWTPCQIALAIPENQSFLDSLCRSGLSFSQATGSSRTPELKGSFKSRGSARLVDLFVSGPTSKEYRSIPTLGTVAAVLPRLSYLMDGAQQTAVLSRDRVVPVRVPAPARFAVHKLMTAGTKPPTATVDKDLKQAAFLLDAVLDQDPGTLDTALDALSSVAAEAMAKGAQRALEMANFVSPRATDLLSALVS